MKTCLTNTNPVTNCGQRNFHSSAQRSTACFIYQRFIFIIKRRWTLDLRDAAQTAAGAYVEEDDGCRFQTFQLYVCMRILCGGKQ